MGGGWALEFESFLGPVKWHGADRRVPFGAQKTLKIMPRNLRNCESSVNGTGKMYAKKTLADKVEKNVKYSKCSRKCCTRRQV